MVASQIILSLFDKTLILHNICNVLVNLTQTYMFTLVLAAEA